MHRYAGVYMGLFHRSLLRVYRVLLVCDYVGEL